MAAPSPPPRLVLLWLLYPRSPSSTRAPSPRPLLPTGPTSCALSRRTPVPVLLLSSGRSPACCPRASCCSGPQAPVGSSPHRACASLLPWMTPTLPCPSPFPSLPLHVAVSCLSPFPAPCLHLRDRFPMSPCFPFRCVSLMTGSPMSPVSCLRVDVFPDICFPTGKFPDSVPEAVSRSRPRCPFPAAVPVFPPVVKPFPAPRSP